MSDLPKNWVSTTSGEVCDYITSGSRDWKSFYSDCGALFVRTQDINQDRLDLSDVAHVDLPAKVEGKRSRIQPGDLLVTITGANVGKVALVPEEIPEAYVSQSVGLMRLKDKRHGPYLHYYLQSDQTGRKQVLNLVYGIGRPVLSLQNLRDVPVALPPLPEQRRIVAEIEKQFTRLEAGVAALRRVQANLKRYRAAVLKAACEGRLVPTDATWPQKQVATAIQTMDQGWSPKCESEPSVSDTTWAVIKTTAIQNLRFLADENKTLPAALKPRPHLELVPGDLLVTRAGPRSRVGVACLVKSARPRLMLCDKAYRLRCKLEVANPAFLELVLNAPHIQDEVNKLKTGISDSGVNLTQKRFGELLVPLPPLSEQMRIVAEVERRLSVVEELESVVSANLQRATRLRQSILQKAFNGELT
jgi:type I restriction enzyme S subunit